ncbi:ankyrin repeat-containing domain protein [Tuber borchii]|uniref:Ankyrin repeat-containing domain protein n=1 Tax=Tuber borchii TaxID=42251 RepID=A0A2T7A4L9_TUBBO|nr:ankyrin repeat-containing domain protein [Tuber borchii]
MFHKRGLLILPPLEHTKLVSPTSVKAHPRRPLPSYSSSIASVLAQQTVTCALCFYPGHARNSTVPCPFGRIERAVIKAKRQKSRKVVDLNDEVGKLKRVIDGLGGSDERTEVFSYLNSRWLATFIRRTYISISDLPPSIARLKMNLIRLPAELQLLIAEKLESWELSYLSRASHYFHSLCTLVFERLAQEPRKWHCALHWAILNNYPPLFQFLLPRGHDINHVRGRLYSGTALHVGASCGHFSLILLILETLALDFDKLDIDGNTALHKAIMWCDPKAVKPLHAAGADLGIANKRGRTAVLLALQYQEVGIMEFLVKNGANVNAQLPAGTGPDFTLLHGLVVPGGVRLVKLALEYGADPEVGDSERRRPIDIAFERGFTGIVDILREASLPLDMDVESDL